jgi:hypothetical protein
MIPLTRIRALCEARGPEPECDEDCEHIECSYVVQCEQWSIGQAVKMRQVIPDLIAEVERLRALALEACDGWHAERENEGLEQSERLAAIRSAIGEESK